MLHNYEAQLKASGFEFVIGVDEAGRGPLAGPVVASAVLIKKFSFTCKIKDSKKISASQRLKAFHEIFENAYVGIGIINESVIDECNISMATNFAMNNAVGQLIGRIPAKVRNVKDFKRSVCLLIDGSFFKSMLPYAHQTVINGDNRVFSIACASIVAKVTRDRILDSYDQIYPQYGFRQHKGYPTKHHKQMINKYGLSLIHRKSYAFNL